MAWLEGWDKRIELKIEDYAGDIGASVTWFPVTVFLTATQGEEVFTELTTDAEYLKVAFTKADGTTELYAEKELFDVSEQKGIFHISRDGWTINANTSIYMYYDKNHADNTTYIGAINTAAGAAVWDGNFKFVCHMVDDTTSTVLDSTTNSNDGTKKAANEPIEVAGKVGQGQDCDGANDYINVPDHADLDFTSAITMEAIVKHDVAASDIIVTKRINGSDAAYGLATDINNKAISQIWIGDVYKSPAGAVDLGTTNFYYIAGTYDDADPNDLLKCYVNDGAAATLDTGGGNIDVTIDPVRIGWGHSDTFAWNGVVDEVRLSVVARAAAWIKGTYNSLYDTLFTYGSEELNKVFLISTANIVVSTTASLSRGIIEPLNSTVAITTSITSTLSRGITQALTSTSTITTSITASLGRGIKKALTSTANITTSITSALSRGIIQSLTSTVNITTSILARLKYDWWEEIKPTIDWTEETKTEISWTEEEKNEIDWDEEEKIG